MGTKENTIHITLLMIHIWIKVCLQDGLSGTYLVVQWLRIHLPRQGTWVRALVWEDPTCCGATKPVRHNY